MSSAWAWYRGRHGEFPEGQLNNGRWWVQMEQRLLQKRAPLPPLLFPRNWALTALKLQVTSFACSKWGAGCNPLTSYQAGRNVASVRTVGPCSACRTMHETQGGSGARMWMLEWGSLGGLSASEVLLVIQVHRAVSLTVVCLGTVLVSSPEVI